MTKNTAIICETNPFHRGHKYLFDTVRAQKQQNSGICIAVMSGNFCQRGIPAVLDKYKRAAVLLQGGADLVVELPFPWCAAGGEAFAAGGVAVASGLLADELAFGSESGDTDTLTHLADWLDTPECRAELLQMEKDDPTLGAAVLHDQLLQRKGVTLSPNDKLAVWYLRQITAQHSPLRPNLVRRTPHTETVVSATKLREMLERGEDITPYVPECAAHLYENETFTDTKRFAELAWLYCRQFASEETACDKSGLFQRMRQVAQSCNDGVSFFRAVATKKYTDARIRRTALFAMTDVSEPKTLPQYTILLGANADGRAYLNRIRKTASIAILTKPAHGTKLPPVAQEQYHWQERADRLYTLCHTPVENGDTYSRRGPVMLLP